MQIAITHQFAGPSPYSLQQHPMPFSDLVALVEMGGLTFSYHRGRIVETDDPDGVDLRMTETAYRADADGDAEAFRYRWDSSG